MISINEAKNILISVIVISLALSISEGGGLSIFLQPAKLSFIISFFAVTVGIGFVLHELAHKFTAIKFGGYAEFKMWTTGLMLALVFSIFGFVFVAPGAVYIYAPRATKKQIGLISLAGPLTNLILAFVFFALALIVPFKTGNINIWYFASKINIWLGLFNMLPIFPLDGSKIMNWNFYIWGFFALLFFLGMLYL